MPGGRTAPALPPHVWVLLVIILTFIVTASIAKTVYVAQNGSPNTPCGTTKSSPCNSDIALSSVVDSGDQILFLPGDYSISASFSSKNVDLAAESANVVFSPSTGAMPILTVRFSRISIQGIQFSKFTSTAIAIADAESQARIDSCVFRDVIIEKTTDPNIIKFNGVAGGAIFSAGSPLHISNSLFASFIVSIPGPVVAGVAVAVISDSCHDKPLNVSFTNTTFESLTVQPSPGSGGAIFISRRSDCLPTSAYKTSLVALNGVKISGCVIVATTSSRSTVDGGALAIHGVGVTLTIFHSDLSLNSISGSAHRSDSSEAWGGALSLRCTILENAFEADYLCKVFISNSMFSGNQATGGDLINTIMFDYGTAGQCGGGAVGLDGFVVFSIDNSSFLDNVCTGGSGGTTGGGSNGGAIALRTPSVLNTIPYPIGTTNYVLDSRFVNNRVLAGGCFRRPFDRGGSPASGGAISILSSTQAAPPNVLFKNVELHSNSAIGGSFGNADGGAIGIFISFSSVADFSVTFVDCNFENNTAAGGLARGGAISELVAVEPVTAGLKLHRCRFSANSACGGVEGDFVGSQGRVSHYPSSNDAEGGAIFFTPAFVRQSNAVSIDVADCNFSSNYATTSEWLLHVGPFGYEQFNTLAGYARGGAISVAGTSLLKLTGAIFENNAVKCYFSSSPCGGGAINAASIRGEHSTFFNNSAASFVPLAPKSGDFLFYVVNDGIPSALVQGGAILSRYNTATFFFSKFDRNSASGSSADGGAIYFAGRGVVRYSELLNNFAEGKLGPANGGAIAAAPADPSYPYLTLVSSCSFVNNSAHTLEASFSSFGGGMSLDWSEGDVLSDSCFLNNTANYGGAVYIRQLFEKVRSFHVNNFTSNTARISGGAFYINLNNNLDSRQVVPPLSDSNKRASTTQPPRITHYDPSYVMPFCENSTSSFFNNNTAPFGETCGLPGDHIVVTKMPPDTVWPGREFEAIFELHDLLGRLVISNATLMASSASKKMHSFATAAAGDIHNMGVASFATSNSNNTAHSNKLDLNNQGSVAPNSAGEYVMTNLILRAAPMTHLSLKFTISAVLGQPTMLYPSYVPSTNHTFDPVSIFPVLVAGCPPGFTLLLLSDGNYDCSRCSPHTYSLKGNAKSCTACQTRERQVEEDEIEPHIEHEVLLTSCLVAPDAETHEEHWIIPQGYFPVPDFEEPEAILACPNPDVCLQYNCSVSPSHDGNWTLDCSHLSNDSYCHAGYTDRLCSRCECSNASNCYFSGSDEEFTCHKCKAPTTAVLASCGVLILVALVGFLLFKHSALAIFIAEVLIAVLLLVLGLGEWWFFDVVIISAVLFVISRSAAKRHKPVVAEDPHALDGPRHDVPAATSQNDTEEGYFVGLIKVTLFFLQTTSAVIPRGAWPSWIKKVVERLNSFNLRIAGIECFNPQLFSQPAVKFGLLMSAPILIILFLGLATIVAVLLSKLTFVQRLQRLEARVSLRKLASRCAVKCCKRASGRNKNKRSAEENGGEEDEPVPPKVESDVEPSDSEATGDESEVEESLLGHERRIGDQHGHHYRHPQANIYWLRFQYSSLFVLFASQFELSNLILSELRPCEEGFMATQPWIRCSWNGDSPAYQWIQILAFIFLGLYLVGIPVLFALLVFFFRRDIAQGEEHVEHRMGFLFETYKREVFFFEIIWLVRRVLLSLSLALLPAGFAGFRTAAISFVLLVSLFVQHKFRPFSSNLVNMLETLSTTVLLYSFIVGNEISSELAVSASGQPASTTMNQLQDITQSVLWIVNALVVVLLVGSLLMPAAKRLWRRYCCGNRRAIRLD